MEKKDLFHPVWFTIMFDTFFWVDQDRPRALYATAYLDYIIIYSNEWQWPIQDLRAVPKLLRCAGLK